MEITDALWQSVQVIPDPFLQILPTNSVQTNLDRLPSALFALGAAEDLSAHQELADTNGLALIRPLVARPDPKADGYWMQDPRDLKSMRTQRRDWQLVGVAQDRHTAMTLGEAGADLILFGHLEPILAAGDSALAHWWAQLFEVPCGLILSEGPTNPKAFGGDGQPEFYACP